MFWILSLCALISNRVKNIWPQTLTKDLNEGGVTPPPPPLPGQKVVRNTILKLRILAGTCYTYLDAYHDVTERGYKLET